MKDMSEQHEPTFEEVTTAEDAYWNAQAKWQQVEWDAMVAWFDGRSVT